MTLGFKTDKKWQIIDISDRIESELKGSGLVNIFLMHTTAAITAADLDPGTDEDILEALELMTPKGKWRHPHDPKHFPDHLWSALIGQSLIIPFRDGKLLLGAWQRVILLEFDGPRERRIELSIV